MWNVESKPEFLGYQSVTLTTAPLRPSICFCRANTSINNPAMFQNWKHIKRQSEMKFRIHIAQ
jgi:hypothetical protein